MSDQLEPLEPLAPLALRALDAERRRGDVDSALQDRLLLRVVASVAVGAAVTAAATTSAAASSTAAGSSAAVTAGAAKTGAGLGAAGLTAKAIPWIVAAFVVGGGTGAAIHAAVVPTDKTVTPSPPTPREPTSGVVASSSVPAVASDDGLPSLPVGALPSVSSPVVVSVPGRPSAAPSVASSAPSSTSTSSGSPSSDVDLAGERALVDRARAAIGRGQNRDALDALDAHALRYPRGRLTEEREALAVDALARSGRTDEARARATRFRVAFPKSVFGAVVDAAVPPR